MDDGSLSTKRSISGPGARTASRKTRPPLIKAMPIARRYPDQVEKLGTATEAVRNAVSPFHTDSSGGRRPGHERRMTDFPVRSSSHASSPTTRCKKACKANIAVMHQNVKATLSSSLPRTSTVATIATTPRAHAIPTDRSAYRPPRLVKTQQSPTRRGDAVVSWYQLQNVVKTCVMRDPPHSCATIRAEHYGIDGSPAAGIGR